MRIQFSADDVRLDMEREEDGKLAPEVAAARNGTALIELTRTELQELLVSVVQSAVEEHGVKIQSADLALSSIGERAVACSLHLRAMKMLVSVEVTIAARADVDEHLTLRISGLKATGDGLIDSIAASVLDTKLAEHEGRAFDLAPRALRHVKLSDLRVDAGDPMRISAGFGV
jgi:hypothetical protein